MKKTILPFLASLLLIWQCQQPPVKKEGLTIVCTTSMVADAVQAIVPKGVTVIALMGPGIDPHLYKATQGDLERIQKADVIVYNGLHLEGKMSDILEGLSAYKTVLALGDFIPASALISYGNAEQIDPHIWFDLSLWSTAVGGVKDALGTKYPDLKDDLDAGFFDFEQDLLATHNWAVTQLQNIPKNQRVLVTAHDAFGYFGRAYDLQVRGLQGISTASEYGLQDITNLVDFIVSNKVPAVYVESSVPKKSVEAVLAGCRAKGHPVILGGQLYSDALGKAGTETATLIGAFKANVTAIATGLMHPTNSAQ